MMLNPGQLMVVVTSYAPVWKDMDPTSSNQVDGVNSGELVMVLECEEKDRLGIGHWSQYAKVLTQHGIVGWIYQTQDRLREA